MIHKIKTLQCPMCNGGPIKAWVNFSNREGILPTGGISCSACGYLAFKSRPTTEEAIDSAIEAWLTWEGTCSSERIDQNGRCKEGLN